MDMHVFVSIHQTSLTYVAKIVSITADCCKQHKIPSRNPAPSLKLCCQDDKVGLPLEFSLEQLFLVYIGSEHNENSTKSSHAVV